MKILSVRSVCFATDSWSTAFFVYDQEVCGLREDLLHPRLELQHRPELHKRLKLQQRLELNSRLKQLQRPELQQKLGL